MTIVPLALAGVFRIDPTPIADERGSFTRRWDTEILAALGIAAPFVQQSSAFNLRAGTLRGLHLALAPAAETKIVRCTRGAAFDVVLDARADSPTYGSHAALELSAANGIAVVIPPGCAHGYQTLTDETEVLYDISEAYRSELAAGIAHDDPALSIAWPLPPHALSARDAALPRLAEFTARTLTEVPT